MSLHYNGDNSYLFVNGTEIIKFIVKDSEIVVNPICLGNASVNDFSVTLAKKLDYMFLFFTLVLITELLKLMIH